MQFDYKKFVDDFRKDGTLDVLCPHDKLQELQDDFAAATGFPTRMYSANLEPFTNCAGFPDEVLANEQIAAEIKREHREISHIDTRNARVAIVPIVVKTKYFGVTLVVADNANEDVLNRLEHSARLLLESLCIILQKSFESYEYKERLEVRKKIDKMLETKNEELQEQNNHDELTGLYSRSYFNKKCAEIEKAEDPQLCVVMGDVNDLKITNDLFGHRHGDFLLKTIAQVMKEEAKILPGCIVARCGGDEMNVLMPHAMRREANWYCHQVLERLKKIDTCCTTPSISLGVGKRSDFEQSVKETINIADVKMYRNKVEYKNQENIVDDIYSVLIRRGYLTENYVNRVEKLGVGFCKYLSSDEVTISHVKMLARIHELGATILPENIYYKPEEERTLIEWREIHKHSDTGSKIAMLNSTTEPVADVILQLHERWDGKGYPRGMKGAQIRPLARIMQVVTEYSRMVEKSKMGWNLTADEARERLRAGAGTIFDPGMVNVFINYLDAVES